MILEKYKCAHLTYKLLLQYLGKCKTVIFQPYSTMILITANFSILSVVFIV